MAKIDEGNFGYASPRQVPQAASPNPEQFDTSGEQAFVHGFRQLTASEQDRVATEREQHDIATHRTQQILHEKIAEENRARSASALVDYDLAVKQAGEGVAVDLQSGKIERDQVAGKFTEAESKVRAETLKQIPPEQQEFIAPRLAKAAERVQWGLAGVVEQHRKATILGYAENIRDGMAKQAVEPDVDLRKLTAQFESAVRVLGPDGGLNPRQVEKVIQDFKDKATSDNLVGQINDNIDNLDGLRDVKRQLLGPVGDIAKQFNTPLTGKQEKAFQIWKQKFAPNDSGADYDLRGAFLAGVKPGPDGHWPDTFKKPNHPTFSDESQYAKYGNPGRWNGNEFIPSTTPGKSYYSLDPERRNVILHSLNAAISTLESRQAADQSRVLAELATDMQAAEKSAIEGYLPNTKQLLDLQKRSAGTALAPHFARLSSTVNYIGQFVGAPLAKMEGELLRLDAQVRKAPTPEGISMVTGLRQLIDSKKRGLKDDSYATAVQAGAPYVALDWTTPANLENTVKSRVAAVKGQAKDNPGANQGIFQEGEARQFRDFVDTQAPANVAALLRKFTLAIGDPTVTAHSMAQVSKEAPALASAGWLASLGQMETATAVIEGDRMLSGKDAKHGAMQIPADEKFRDVWRRQVGDSYAGKPGPEDMDFEASKAIYMSLARAAGKTSDKEINPSLWRKSIDMATGGIQEYRGNNVLRPFGVDAQEFVKRTHTALDKAFNSGEIAGAGKTGTMKAGPQVDPYAGLDMGQQYHLSEQLKNNPPAKDKPDEVHDGQLSRDYLKDLPLETIGQGRYRVRQGTSYVVNDAGYPLVLDLRKTPPAYYWDADHGRLPVPAAKPAPTDPLGEAVEPANVRAMKRDPAIDGSPLFDTKPLQLNPDTAAPLSKPGMKRDRKDK